MHNKIREFIVHKYGYHSSEYAYANLQAEYGVDWAVWVESDSAVTFANRLWKEKSKEEKETIRKEAIKSLRQEKANLEESIFQLIKLQEPRTGKGFNIRFSNERAWSKEEEEINGPSLFLAGPTPRNIKQKNLISYKSYRQEACRILEKEGFKGTVLVPEVSNWVGKNDYLDQVEWEEAGLANCTIIAFWINRKIECLPGLTTNVEFGRWYENSERRKDVIYGRPKDAEKCKYLDWLYKRNNNNRIFSDLSDLMQECIKKCK